MQTTEKKLLNNIPILTSNQEDWHDLIVSNIIRGVKIVVNVVVKNILSFWRLTTRTVVAVNTEKVYKNICHLFSRGEDFQKVIGFCAITVMAQ